MKPSFAQILQQVEQKRSHKMADKLPAWAGVGGLEFPTDLCLEQCSSQAAALFKASLTGSPATIADLTGGIGADCWAFSKVAGRVLYFEKNPELAQAAEGNFKKLGALNINVTNACTSEELIDGLDELDWIYLDPARRDNAGRKVFLIEDCTPDVLTLLPALWRKTDNIMLKLSPMADISMLAAKLGGELQKVHVVSSEGEAKELLCILRKGNTESYTIEVDIPDMDARMAFSPAEERSATPVFDGTPAAGQYLHEPCAALLKSGAFRLPCRKWGLRKMAPFTHLYLSDYGLPADAAPFFKSFLIQEVQPMGAAGIKAFARAYPKADVSARNIPMTSEQLRAKLKCAPSNDGTHIFGCAAGESRQLIACRRVK